MRSRPDSTIRWTLKTLAAALVIVLAACTGSSSGEADSEVAEQTPLVLSGNSLGAAKLGDSFESVTTRLRARWGPPERTSEFGCESFAMSKVLNWDGVMLVFNESGLAGYLVGPRPVNPITPVGRDVGKAASADGLSLGATVTKAREIYGSSFVLEETSLGPEWYIESEPRDSRDLRGFASGLTETDIVDRIGAGDICAVR